VAGLNLNSTPDIVTGGEQGNGPEIQVFDGATLNPLQNFVAYDASFKGGVFVG
jgi:large repetitive protein